MKKTYEFLLVALCIAFVFFAVLKITPARHAVVIAVWNMMDWTGNRSADKAALPEGIKIEQDMTYVERGTLEQVLDVYYPENARGKLPIIIFTHGGGFVSGDKKQTRQYCMSMAKEGYTVFNLNYRLAPQYKISSQISDVLLAMLWIKDNSEKYFGDKNKIILAGNSAGAYLTGLAACISTNEGLASRLNLKPVFSAGEIKGIMLFSGVYDLGTGSKTGFPSIKSDIEMLLGTNNIKEFKNLDDYSVTKNITAQYPKVFISSGESDWLHSESIELVKALDKNNVYYKDVFMKKAMHDYQLHLDKDNAQKCMGSVLEFLKAGKDN